MKTAAEDQACAHIWVHVGDKSNLRQACMKCSAPRTSISYPVGIEFRDSAKVGEGRIEQRFMLTDLVIADEESRTFEGYGCRFDVCDSYDTVFVPGCFAESLAEWRSQRMWPSFYLQHDWDMIIGGWNDMFEDRTGLFVRGDFIKSAWGDHARALVKEKRAKGLSIGFVTQDYEIKTADDGTRVRYVKKAQLWEVSLVERAAVPGSGVTAIRADMSVRQIEDVLTTIGAPAKAAKAMASQWRGKGAGEERDAPPEPSEQEARDASEVEAQAQKDAHAREARAGSALVNQSLIAIVDNARRSLTRT